MQRFAQLFDELDRSNRTLDKVDALKRYFGEAAPEDAAWALWLLMGNRLRAPVRAQRLREWAGAVAGLPDWLVEDCYERVGDLAETVALLLPPPEEPQDVPLHEMLTEHVQGLGDWDAPVQFQLLREHWRKLDRSHALVFHKLLTGAFRVGVSRNLVTRAVAELAGVDKAMVAHRLMGQWQPTAVFFRRLLEGGEQEEDLSRPYPFYLASPLEDPEMLWTRPEKWLVEWKWDGIRAQLIKRRGRIFIWSRGEDLLSERFPEILQAAARLPDGTVLDGEILCWRDERPLGFNALQTRIGRKRLSPRLLAECPAILLAYDLLEADGVDRRSEPLHARRGRLGKLMAQFPAEGALQLSPLVQWETREALEALRDESRARGVEGFMLKQRDSVYEAGRIRGNWWKWKVAPLTADLVMVCAQAGHGRRASQFTDYTLAAWNEGVLVTVAKAYSGLTAEEIREVDRWVKAHTLARHGPVRTVPGELVFEIAFEGIRESNRHKSGLALRFPRIHRWRRDKPASDADTLETLRRMLAD